MMSAAGAIVAAALFWGFLDRTNSAMFNYGFMAVLTSYGTLALVSRRWLRVENKLINYIKFLHIFQIIQFILGVSWSVVMTTAISSGNENQRSLIYALSIALISTTMISGTAKYSLSFWIPVTIGSFVAFLFNTAYFYTPILIALCCYSLISFYSIISLNKKMFDKELNIVDIENKNEIIEILLKDFQEGTKSFLWETDSDLRITNFSDQIDLTKIKPKDHGAIKIFDFLNLVKIANISGRRTDFVDIITSVKERINNLKLFKDAIILVPAMSGPRWWTMSGKPIYDNERKFIGYRGICSDVTERETYRRKIEFDAEMDYLTKTYNRASFNRIIEKLCRISVYEQSALLCLDLDRFKSVNDSFGHAIGDSLLLTVSQRIAACVRSEDYVFRLGGDEFAIAIPGGGQSEAISVAQRIVEKLEEPFHFEKIRVKIGASVGIAFIPNDGDSPDGIHRKADLALYRAKSESPGSYRIFDQKLDNRVELAQIMQIELGLALEREQLSLMYQPIVNLVNGKVVSAETLLRWQHADFGDVLPSQFIPLLEQNGKIFAVGEAVIDSAVRVAGSIRSNIRVTINLSPYQLVDVSLPQKVAMALSNANVSADRIEFEITESSLLDDDPQKMAVLHSIKKIGCRISLDDFGTGYSSLRLLDKFPFDKLKIDGSFIRGGVNDVRRNHILETMILLGKKLGLVIIGEGVESQEQVDRLVSLGCCEGQGFYFYRPIPTDEFVRIFAAGVDPTPGELPSEKCVN